MKNYKPLLKKDLWTFKNHLLQIKRDPKRMIIYIFYLLWFGAIFYNGINAMNRKEISDFNINLGPQIMGSIFILLVTGLLMFSLYQGTKESSTFFNMGDIHFLFPSPISPKKILLYNMIKYSILYLFLYLFVMAAFIPMIANLAKVEFRNLPYMYIGLLSAVIVIEPLRFLIFSIGTKYRIQSFLQRAVYVILGTFVLYILGSIIYHREIVKGVLLALNAPFMEYLPLIGWSKTIFMSSITGFSTYTLVTIVLETILIIACIYFAYYTADDYYEDVIGITEKRTIRKRNKKAGKGEVPSFFTKRRKNVQVKGKRKGPMALLWKTKVEYHRTDLHAYFSVVTIILFVLGVIAGIIGVRNGADVEMFYIANGALAYIIFIFSVATTANHELTKPYIYLIPGSALKKIIAVHQMDVIRMVINSIIFNVVLGLALNVSISTITILSIFVITFYILSISSNFIVRVIFPSKLDQKVLSLFFMLVQFIFIILPGGIAGIISAVVFDNGLAFFIAVVLVNTIEITILLLLSNVIFMNIEWK